MSFQFNFEIEQDFADSSPSQNKSKYDDKNGCAAENASIVSLDEMTNLSSSVLSERLRVTDDVFLFRRNIKDAQYEILCNDTPKDCTVDYNKGESALLEAIERNSDLLPGKYEGGMKTWECSMDLVRFLIDINSTDPSFFHGKVVLEIGCGSALPGIFCLCKTLISQIDFQDYNKEVIKRITVPNILLNESAEVFPPDQDFAEIEIDWQRAYQIPKVGQYFSGDWSSLPSLLEMNGYDLILAAETIFSPSSYEKHAKVISHSLRRSPSSVALIACKNYYFGCGGSSNCFRNYLEAYMDGQNNARFVTALEATFDSGNGVRREVISVKFVDKGLEAVR